MEHPRTLLLAAATLTAAILSPRAAAQEPADTFLIPERAIVATGDADNGRHLVGILYNPVEAHFTDPTPPRFLFLDSEGKVAFGIGGYIKGSARYDFDGAVDDGPSFYTHDIAVPNRSDQNQALGATFNHSVVFMQLVGTTSHFGNYEVYVMTRFSQGSGDTYGVQVKKVYLRLGNLMAGYNLSPWMDPGAAVPVVDDQGPSGSAFAYSAQVRYTPKFGRHWGASFALEIPQAAMTLTDHTRKIAQRVPDISSHIQYSWQGGHSHVRLTAMLRNLVYRDEVRSDNRFVTGYGFMLSGAIGIAPQLSLLCQASYGRGMANYINDLNGYGYDLIPTSTPGRLTAPRSLAFEAGARLDVSPSFFLTGCYSQARVYDQQAMGPQAYRYAQYATVSGFYDIIPDLRLGLQYIYGNRADMSGIHGHANRVTAMIQYSF